MNELNEAEALQRAQRCFSLMSENEKAILRFGMCPHWIVKKNLNGRVKNEFYPDIELDKEANRLLSIALMKMLKMIA